MGNCIHVLSRRSHEKVEVITLNGGEKKFKSATPIKRITSGRYNCYKLVNYAQLCAPLPQDTKIERGEVYHLVPDSVSPAKAIKESYKTGKVKIVMTRQQMELLQTNVKKLQSGKLAVRFSESLGEGYRKWHPSLASILEVRDF